MAAEITHILFTDKLYLKYFSDKNKAEFYIGSCLPDIRYLEPHLNRHNTHFEIENIYDVIREENCLLAGIKFHCLTDISRKNFLANHAQIIEKYSPLLFDWWSFKLLEDEILYHKLNDWPKIIGLIQIDSTSQIPYELSSGKYNKYISILKNYFRQPPNKISQKQFLQALGYSDLEIADEEKIITDLKSNSPVIATIKLMYDQIEEIMTHD